MPLISRSSSLLLGIFLHICCSVALLIKKWNINNHLMSWNKALWIYRVIILRIYDDIRKVSYSLLIYVVCKHVLTCFINESSSKLSQSRVELRWDALQNTVLLKIRLWAMSEDNKSNIKHKNLLIDTPTLPILLEIGQTSPLMEGYSFLMLIKLWPVLHHFYQILMI